MIENFLRELNLKGWKKKDIAERTGLTHQYISSLSNGSNCSIDVLLKIADAFEVSTDVVLGRQQGRLLTPVEDMLLNTTDGNDQIARAALRSAQGEKSLIQSEGESGQGQERISA